MRNALAIFVAVLAALAQVTMAPLFPVSGAVADLGLITVVAVALALSPVAAMVALPVLAVSLAFVSDRAAGLLIIAYLPLLPLVFFMDERPLPMGRYLRLLLPVVATGLWARGVLALGAIAGGAEVQATILVRDILLPGMVFDAALLTLLYLPLRFAGLSGRRFTLRRTEWGLA